MLRLMLNETEVFAEADRIIEDIAKVAYRLYKDRYSHYLPQTFTEIGIQEFLAYLLERARHDPAFVCGQDSFSLQTWDDMPDKARIAFLRKSVCRKTIDQWRRENRKAHVSLAQPAQPNDEAELIEAAISTAGADDVSELLGQSPLIALEEEVEGSIFDDAPVAEAAATAPKPSKGQRKPRQPKLQPKSHISAGPGDVADLSGSNMEAALDARQALRKLSAVSEGGELGNLSMLDELGIIFAAKDPLTRAWVRRAWLRFWGEGERDATEREVAAELKTPKSTVHRHFEQIEKRVRLYLAQDETKRPA